MSIYNTAQPVLYYIPTNNHHKTMHHHHHHSNHAQHHHNVYTQIEQQHAAMNAMSQRKHVLPSFNNLLNNIYQIDYNYNYTHIQQPHPIASASSPASRNNSFDNYTYTTTNNNIPHHHNNSIGSITPPVQHNIPQYIHTPPVQSNNTGHPINTPPASITNIDSTSNSNITPRSCKFGKPGQAAKPGKGAAKQKRKRKNYVKKRTNSIKDIITSATPTKRCFQCQEVNTPEWRLGPYGNRSLCNACGLYYRRLIQRFDLKQANLIMRFNKFVKPVNNMRQIPNQIDIPNSIIKQLDDDPHLDSNYNNID